MVNLVPVSKASSAVPVPKKAVAQPKTAVEKLILLLNHKRLKQLARY
ncbi:hypothetical protein ACVPOR_03075 [Staphylococcus aureus]